jgi:DNA-binding NarL/FixJ family response regulator
MASRRPATSWPPVCRRRCPGATRALIGQFTAQPPEAPSSRQAAQIRDALTSRELDVFSMIAAGMSNGEIAANLHLSPGTVKIHVGRILAKLGLRDRVQAVVLAYESTLVVPGTTPQNSPRRPL